MDNLYSSIKSLLEDISSNTHPLEFIYGNLNYWSFGAAIISLFITFFALYYQKKATENLDMIVPDQIRLDEITYRLYSSLLDIEAIFFGTKLYSCYPVSFILSRAKLPEDLIVLKTFENKKRCYDEAFKLKLAWRDYNLYVDRIIEYNSTSSDNVIEQLVELLQANTKLQLKLIKTFESILIEERVIRKESMSIEERLASFILNKFFENIQLLKLLKIGELDTSRKNFIEKGGKKGLYLSLSPIPKIIDIDKYVKTTPVFSFVEFDDHEIILLDKTPEIIIKKIKGGDYNFINQYLHNSSLDSISNIDFRIFYNAYYNYIEPILLGINRYNYYRILHPEDEQTEKVTENKIQVPNNRTKGEKKSNKGKAGKKK